MPPQGFSLPTTLEGLSAELMPIPQDVQVKQKQGQAAMMWTIGAFCIFGWELLICLPKEYKRIWKRPKSLPSILYIVNRYFGLIQLSLVISLVANAWSPEDCKHVFYFEPVGALISTVLSQMILGSRIYAIYAQNKVVAFILGTTLLVEVVVGGISISTTSSPPVIAGPPGSRPPCSAVMGPFGWLIAFWTIPLFYDAIAFLLTAWKALEFWRQEIDTPLFDIIWRDGLLYFFAIFSMNLTNVIIFSTTPTALRAINLTPTLIFEVVLSCRMVLNIRGANKSSAFQSSGQHKWNSYPPSKTNNAQAMSSEEGQHNSFADPPVGVNLQSIQKSYSTHTSEIRAIAP